MSGCSWKGVASQEIQNASYHEDVTSDVDRKKVPKYKSEQRLLKKEETKSGNSRNLYSMLRIVMLTISSAAVGQENYISSLSVITQLGMDILSEHGL